jgi:hypothetical protein
MTMAHKIQILMVVAAVMAGGCGDDGVEPTATGTSTGAETGTTEAATTEAPTTEAATTEAATTEAATTEAATTEAATTEAPTTGTTGGAGYTFTVTSGFAVPESCLWDPASQYWYVSNIAPQSMDFTAPDGQGWISRLDKDGAIVDAQWASGFDTPAGLRIADGVLFVNDIKKVHEIDVATGKTLLTHEFPDAVLLNDPAIDEAAGIGYATDTFGNAIYQFKVGELGGEAPLLVSPALKGPNGLLFADDRLYVASLVDFDPANLGPFLSVDVAAKTVTQVGATLGKFDGIEPWQGRFLLSDNGLGRLVAIDAEGASEVLFDLMADHGFAPAADHGVDPVAGVICVPNLADSVGFVRTQ